MSADVGFYCVSSEAYFPAAVAMINSLRLAGYSQPVYVADCGLTPRQRALISPEATVVDVPAGRPPHLAKSVAPLRHPHETTVLIDADMIVSRSLDPLIEEASRGRIVAFADNRDRFVAGWGELPGLDGPARRRRYVTSALVFLGGSVGREVIESMERLAEAIPYDPTFSGPESDPFLYADQDLLNAILATRIDPAIVSELEPRMIATNPDTGIASIDPGRLRCAYEDGVEPFVVHHILDRKPWLGRTYRGVYARFLQRCISGPGLAIEIPPRWLPLRLRAGRLAELERVRGDATVSLLWHAGISLHRARKRIERVVS